MFRKPRSRHAERLLSLLRTLAVVAAALGTQGTGRADTNVVWTVEDVVGSEEASSFRISPDCHWAVWVKKVPDRQKNVKVSHLVLSSLTEEKEIQLTRGPDSCTEPKWAPDGRHIAFFTDRAASEGKSATADEPTGQLWLINPFGGEPWALTTRAHGIVDYDWGGSDTIIFAGQDEAEASAETASDPKDSTVVVEEAKEPVRLFELAIMTKKVRRLTCNEDRIQAVTVAPDGRWAVTFHERSPRFNYDNKIKPVYYLYDLKTGTGKQVYTDRKFNLEMVRWDRASQGFYAANDFTTDPRYVMATVTDLSYYDLATGTITGLDLGWKNGLASQVENEDSAGFQVTSDGFLALLANGVHNEGARYTRQGGGWRHARLTGAAEGHIFGLEVGNDDRTLVYAYSTASTPTQWYRARLTGDRIQAPVPLTHLNPCLKTKPIAHTEVVHWKGARDDEVEGMLYYPHHYQAGRKYPLIVLIHGGPDYADLNNWDESWSHPQNLLAAHGAFVFKPNYHGSSNYGLAWTEALAGNYYDLEITDIEKGVDSLVARGLADPEKLGVMGHSNGAILAAALTVHTTRYRAASVMAGTVEQASDWGFTRFGAAFDHYYLGKTPFEDPRLYLDKSPFYHLDRVRTPTLICFGEDDRIVGPCQGWMHYRALQELGNAPVRFLLFPDEGHDLDQLTHQRRKLREELEWFDKYLFETGVKSPGLPHAPK